MFQQNSFPKCLHGFFSILNQNKNKFWNINVLCTGTATHWPTPLFYWILVFHVMRKHFVLFVPKSDMTENLTTLSIIYIFYRHFLWSSEMGEILLWVGQPKCSLGIFKKIQQLQKKPTTPPKQKQKTKQTKT